MSAPAAGRGAPENAHPQRSTFGAERRTGFATWDAAAGRPGPVHVRIDRADGSKRFLWPAGTATNDLVYFAPGPEPPPLDATPRLVVTEGEKPAGAVARAGFPAAGLVGGASTLPGAAVVSLLASYPDVVLWRDKDDVGRRLMQRLAAELERAGLRRCHVVDPPADLPEHGDAADLPPERVRALIEGARELVMLPEAHRPEDGGDDRPADELSDLAAVLDAVVAFLRRFVRLARAEQYDAVALWAAHTHAVEACEYSPLLYVTSPVWRSGKSRLFEALEGLVARPWKVIQPSEAVLFRKVHADRPTLLLDEADTTFNRAASKRGDNEPVRAILNAGNRRGTSVPRLVPRGKSFEIQEFSIFGAKAVAGIGDLPATIVDRSITIAMERLAPGEKVEKLRLRDIEPLGAPLRTALAAALAGATDLTIPTEAFPPGLDARAEDGWEPLLAIARLAGRDWPERAARAAVFLSAERAKHQEEDVALVLLRDCQEAFREDLVLTSSELVERLCDLPDTDWRIFRGDRPISAKKVASFLARFGVEPRKTRTSNQYFRADFEPAWSRYLDPSSTSSTPSTEAPSGPGFTLNQSRITPVEDRVEDPPHNLPHPSGPGFTLNQSRITTAVEDAEDVEGGDGPTQPRPPCFADAVTYRVHQPWHRKVGAGWRCRVCEAAGAEPPPPEPEPDDPFAGLEGLL